MVVSLDQYNELTLIQLKILTCLYSCMHLQLYTIPRKAIEEFSWGTSVEIGCLGADMYEECGMVGEIIRNINFFFDLKATLKYHWVLVWLDIIYAILVLNEHILNLDKRADFTKEMKNWDAKECCHYMLIVRCPGSCFAESYTTRHKQSRMTLDPVLIRMEHYIKKYCILRCISNIH